MNMRTYAVALMMAAATLLAGCSSDGPLPPRADFDAPGCVESYCPAMDWKPFRPGGFKVSVQPVIVGGAADGLLANANWLIWSERLAGGSSGERQMPGFLRAIYSFNLETELIDSKGAPRNRYLLDGFHLMGNHVLYTTVSVGTDGAAKLDFSQLSDFEMHMWNLTSGRTQMFELPLPGDVEPVGWDGDWFLLRIADAGELYRQPAAASERMVVYNVATNETWNPDIPLLTVYGDSYERWSNHAVVSNGTLYYEEHSDQVRASAVHSIDLQTRLKTKLADFTTTIIYFEPNAVGVVAADWYDIVVMAGHDEVWSLSPPTSLHMLFVDPWSSRIMWVDAGTKFFDKGDNVYYARLWAANVETGEIRQVAEDLVGTRMSNHDSSFFGTVAVRSESYGYSMIYELDWGDLGI